MASFSKLLASRLAKQQHSPDVHPEADVLNAFAENQLPGHDRQTVLAHLATCPECREVLQFIAPDAPVHTSHIFTWQNLRWPLAAAATLLLTFSVLHHKPAQSLQPTPNIVVVAPPPPAQSKPVPPPTPVIAIRKHLPGPVTVPKALAPPPQSLPAAAPAIAQEVNDVSPMNKLQQAAQDQVSSVPPASQVFRAKSLALHKLNAVPTAIRSNEDTLWSLDSKQPGTIRASTNGGASWTVVPLNTSAAPLALAGSGSEVWVGGEQGTLFHSIDNGTHWTRMIVTDGAHELKDSITAIEAPPAAKILRIKTHSASWFSLDQGRTWQKQSNP